jgi:peptidoglycan/xylan/chitin deacetylase (PgdA/CDA1 family)
LSFDSDHETNELREGGHSIGKLSQGQYGNRQGIPRILDVLSRASVPASFYVPAVVAQLDPDEQRRVVAEGHEVALHGWIHERNSVLPEPAERDLMMRSADALERITGTRPVGIRTPSWDFSPATLAVYFNMNRFASLRPHTAPADVFDIFRRELEAAFREGGIFQLTMHPHIIGYRSRIWIVEELIRHARSLGPVWFATHADIVRHVKAHC